MMSKQKSVKIDYTTHEGIMSGFVDSTQDVLKQVDDKIKQLEQDNDDAPETKAYHTRKIILGWFRTNGGI